MKTLRIISTFILLILLGYIISCDINNPVKNEVSNKTDGSHNECIFNCKLNDYCCQNNCRSHFCLDLSISINEVEWVDVWHTGNDCQNNAFNCSYHLTEPESSYAAGCYVPNGPNVYITRYVCGKTKNGLHFYGQLTFHPADPGCIVPLQFNSGFVCPYEETPD
jgi:hypothetical protein